MHYSDEYGIEAPELGWLPSPAYLLRRSALLDILDGMKPGTFLEIGCGAGAFTVDLLRRGFTGLAVEEDAGLRDAARTVLAGRESIRLLDRLPGTGPLFDYVFVLDRVEDIEAAGTDGDGELRRWGQFLRPGGRLVVTVPARRAPKAKGGRTRGRRPTPRPGQLAAPVESAGPPGPIRFDRRTAMARLRMAGYRVREVFSWGFPLGRAMERLEALLLRRELGRQGLAQPHQAPEAREPLAPDVLANARRTAVARAYPIYSNIIAKILFAVLMHTQGLFLERDLGTGYVIIADVFE